MTMLIVTSDFVSSCIVFCCLWNTFLCELEAIVFDLKKSLLSLSPPNSPRMVVIMCRFCYAFIRLSKFLLTKVDMINMRTRFLSISSFMLAWTYRRVHHNDYTRPWSEDNSAGRIQCGQNVRGGGTWIVHGTVRRSNL
jgi:hypothetical protein